MISLYYTSHTKAYNTIYTACNIVEAIYSFTLPQASFGRDGLLGGRDWQQQTDTDVVED